MPNTDHNLRFEHEQDMQDLIEREDAELAARGLPPVAYIDNTWNKSPGASPVIAVRRGERGFYPIYTLASADKLNEAEGVTTAQAQAMHIGSMYGWDKPGAHPGAQVQ